MWHFGTIWWMIDGTTVRQSGGGAVLLATVMSSCVCVCSFVPTCVSSHFLSCLPTLLPFFGHSFPPVFILSILSFLLSFLPSLLPSFVSLVLSSFLPFIPSFLPSFLTFYLSSFLHSFLYYLISLLPSVFFFFPSLPYPLPLLPPFFLFVLLSSLPPSLLSFSPSLLPYFLPSRLQTRFHEILQENNEFRSSLSLMENKVDQVMDENGALSSQVRKPACTSRGALWGHGAHTLPGCGR